jgi:hypothetical protein
MNKLRSEGRVERERKGVVVLNTLIRLDQSMDLHKISLLCCRHKEEIVREALDLYFQQKYGKKAVVHLAIAEEGKMLS